MDRTHVSDWYSTDLWRYPKRLLVASLDSVAPRMCYWLRSQWLRRNGEPEISLLHRFCRADGTAVDVGGYRGDYAYVMSKYARSVHVFEPNPSASGYLGPRMPANVEVHELALSDRRGLARLRVPQAYKGLATIEAGNSLADVVGAVDTETVRTEPLDLFELKNVSFIKIDVEGHELLVLRGGTDTISRNLPVLQIEIEERHAANSLADIPDFLKNFGYSGFFLDAELLRPLNHFEAARDQDRANLSAAGDLKLRAYINNFIFLQECHLRDFADIVAV